jgi:aminodeoxyfutalosine synthase
MEMISEADVQELVESRDLIAIGVRADDVRRRLHGARTTFVRVFEVHVDAIPAAVPAGTSAGEFRIVGRPASADAAIAAGRSVVALANGTPVTAFSLADLLAVDGPSSLTEISRSLREIGVEGIAEAPIDLLDDAASAIAAARSGGLSVLRLTVQGGGNNDRRLLAERARDLQAAVGGMRAFAPLPRTITVASPTTGYDDVKQIALARVIAANIESIQVDWQLYGPKLAQFALTTGADDVDSVAAHEPGTLGTRRSAIEEIRGNIRSAALDPVERNARFEAIG